MRQLVAERQPRRSRAANTWVAGAAAACVAGAVVLSMSPAQARSGAVTGTFGVTGTRSSACPTGIGGNALYVKPEQLLKAKTSTAGVSVIGVVQPDLTELHGTLTIKNSSGSPVYQKSIAKTESLVGTFRAGNYSYTFVATSVDTAVTSVPASAFNAGVKTTWSGTIYVTSTKDPCGLAISVPTTKVTASVPGLPGVTVTVPGGNVTLPGQLPSIISKLPTLPNLPNQPGAAKTTKAGSGKTSRVDVNYTPPAVTVPEKVMPYARGGSVGFPPPDVVGPQASGRTYVGPVAQPVTRTDSAGPASDVAAGEAGQPVDPSAKKPSGSPQLPMLLAIVAILALATVTAATARLYLMRRSS